MSSIVLAFAILEKGYGASVVGELIASKNIPLLLFMTFGGLLGDRLPRPLVMIGSDLLRFISQGFLGYLLVRSRPEVITLMLLTSMGGVGQAFFRPAISGLIPEIISSEDDLKDANSALSIVESFGYVVGPALGGLMVAFVNGGWALIFDAFTYITSAVLLMNVNHAFTKKVKYSGIFKETLEGWKEFFKRRWIYFTTFQISGIQILVTAPIFVLGTLTYSHAHHGALSWGLVMTLEGAGALFGGLLTNQFHFRCMIVPAEFFLLSLCIFPLLLAFQAPFIFILFSSAVYGCGSTVFSILWDTAFQKDVPTDLMSRVSACDTLIAIGLRPLGDIFAGPAAHIFGTNEVFTFSGLYVIVSVLIIGTLIKAKFLIVK